MHPPRRLGSSLKFLLRASIGAQTSRSVINRRSSVFLADARLTVLLIVTRTFEPLLNSMDGADFFAAAGADFFVVFVAAAISISPGENRAAEYSRVWKYGKFA